MAETLERIEKAVGRIEGSLQVKVLLSLAAGLIGAMVGFAGLAVTVSRWIHQ